IVAGSIRDAFGFQREMVVTGMVEIHGNPRFEFAKDLVPLPLRDQLGPMPNDEDEIRELSARDEPWERVVELIDPYYLVRPRYLDEEDARSEQERFDELEQELRQAMQSVPELEVLADHLQIEHAPEGLRIQIVDQARLSMFPLGSAEMSPPTRRLLRRVAAAIRLLPNKVSIPGHTDRLAYRRTNDYDN